METALDCERDDEDTRDAEAVAWKATLEQILADPRYANGITYGKPRTGHGEGTVKRHIDDLLNNLLHLAVTRPREPRLVSDVEIYKLAVLVHVHDTFKYWAKRDSAIEDPRSHASLARKFLEEFTVDTDMLMIVQYHDEGYALWKQVEARGRYNEARFRKCIASIADLELFLLFTLLDGYTPSKEHERIRWFFGEVAKVAKLGPRMEQALQLFGI